LALSNNPLSLYTLYGVIALTGIAVNSAIVLIDAANSRLQMGLSTIHAIVQAAKTRMTWLDGRMLPASELVLDGLQSWPGVCYEIKLALDDGFFAYLNWADTLTAHGGAAEATLGVTFTMPHPSESIGPAGVSMFAEMSSAGTLTFAEVGSTGDTITRTVGSWLTDGFRPLQSITIGGTVSNDGVAIISSVTPTVLTLTTFDLTAEAIAASGVTITGG
jgi:hypothetical protein